MRTIAAGTAICAAAAFLGGCGGGGGVAPASPAAATTAVATPAPGSGTLSITIVVPPATSTSATARTAKYISPSTQSVTIGLTGSSTPLSTANLTATSPGCATSSAGITCTVTANAPAGSQLFTVTAYSGLNGSGNALSTANVPATVSPSSTTRLPLALNGVVANVAVTLGTSTMKAGTTAAVAVTVTAYDANSNAIVGPGNFASPVTLSDSDSTATSLSATTVQAPGTSVTLNYNGNSLSSATITPTFSGKTGTSATFTVTGASVALYPATTNLLQQSFLIDRIVAGPSNSVWLADYYYNDSNVSSFAGSGAQAAFTLNGFISDVGGAGAAGAKTLYYFDADCGDNVGVIDTTTHQLNSQSGISGYESTNIPGPDSNLWFGEGGPAIGRITPLGDLQEWSLSSLPGYGSAPTPTAMAFSADGTQLYLGGSGGYLSRVMMSNFVPTATSEIINPSSCGINSVVVGPDGNPWFADSCGNIGVVPAANFTAGAILSWNVESYTNGNSITQMLSTPAGLFAEVGGAPSASVYFLSGLSSMTSMTGPALNVLPIAPSGTNLESLTIGNDNNVWILGQNQFGPNNTSIGTELVARVIYGGSGIGTPATAQITGVVRRVQTANMAVIAARKAAQKQRRKDAYLKRKAIAG